MRCVGWSVRSACPANGVGTSSTNGTAADARSLTPSWTSGQVTALIYYGKGRDTEIRAESFRRMADSLIDRNVARLIESREGRDDLHRHTTAR